MKHVPARVRRFLVVALLSIGATLLVVAMLCYPGGRAGDPTTRGFDPFRNYFCDLISPRSHGGEDNTIGMLSARAGMLVTGLALLPLWLHFPLPLSPRRERLMQWSGACSTLAMPAVAWTPSAHWPHWHSLAILAAGVPGGLALGLAVWAVIQEREASRGLFRLTVAMASAAASVGALWSWTFVATWPELALPSAQKLAWLLLLAWATALARR